MAHPPSRSGALPVSRDGVRFRDDERRSRTRVRRSRRRTRPVRYSPLLVGAASLRILRGIARDRDRLLRAPLSEVAALAKRLSADHVRHIRRRRRDGHRYDFLRHEGQSVSSLHAGPVRVPGPRCSAHSGDVERQVRQTDPRRSIPVDRDVTAASLRWRGTSSSKRSTTESSSWIETIASWTSIRPQRRCSEGSGRSANT